MEFVAEIGSMHKGIKALAYEMIRQFSQAGATICKFQLGHEKGKPEDPIQCMRYAPMLWVEDLARWCDDFSVEFMASIWSQEGLDAARAVGMKRYKIAHQMKDNDELIQEIVSYGRQTFISGMTNQTWKARGLFELIDYPLVQGLWCKSEYPCYDVSDMPRDFIGNQYAGYSSHMHGIADALIAIARGARYIEKHVTLSKSEESIKDNAFALSPQEFADMVKYGKEIYRLIS